MTGTLMRVNTTLFHGERLGKARPLNLLKTSPFDAEVLGKAILMTPPRTRSALTTMGNLQSADTDFDGCCGAPRNRERFENSRRGDLDHGVDHGEQVCGVC